MDRPEVADFSASNGRFLDIVHMNEADLREKDVHTARRRVLAVLACESRGKRGRRGMSTWGAVGIATVGDLVRDRRLTGLVSSAKRGGSITESAARSPSPGRGPPVAVRQRYRITEAS
jgi:hypothetical protein